MLDALPLIADPNSKRAHYSAVFESIKALLEHETDWVAGMATVVCELHQSFAYYHWTGFYRVVREQHLKIGPYQGAHGCIDIPFSRGVCGAAARTGQTQLVPDVNAFPGHIACSSTTRSEIVVPVFNPAGQLLAVFDVDCNDPAAFDAVDQEQLEAIMAYFGQRFPMLPCG
ncbi:GAF domain-containing protein [Oligoflexus tunisiensis]|uniref:GAF domain-containing protein n=1 Tax=Oligoflexus tunisiensis TaxID=708132 RepID=UPI000AF08926|nr:GAF domain-containing protein [Oligoflexus tunisiensis]